jgi:FMN-dependent NADH-azoreductase
MTLLQIKSSLFGDAGQSSRLADAFVASWRASHAEDRVVVRDLARDPVPHLTAETFRAFTTPAADRTQAQHDLVTLSDRLIDELRAADVIVLGLPMYNFGVPSTLKAYFDHVARAGVTFRYTENGPVGLLAGKLVYVLAARGGRYVDTGRDTQSAYVRTFLAFLGLDEVEFVYAEGLALGPAPREAALAQANAVIARLAEREAVPA